MRIRVCGRSFKTIVGDAAPRSDPPKPLTLEELDARVVEDTKLRNDSWRSPAPNPAAANVRDWSALKNLNELHRKFWESH